MRGHPSLKGPPLLENISLDKDKKVPLSIEVLLVI